MRIVSIAVGRPRDVVVSDRRSVTTSIFKTPVTGPVRIGRLNLEGDEQSDLTVHGGVNKAVYVYPMEHYAFWREELPGASLPYGAFGENITSDGMLEETVHIGDRLRIGSAECFVTQPRLPCFKLGIRFGRSDMVKRFLASRRTGFYLRVEIEGVASAGDAIAVVSRHPDAISVAEIVDVFTDDRASPDRLRRAIALPALPNGWKKDFRRRLDKIA